MNIPVQLSRCKTLQEQNLQIPFVYSIHLCHTFFVYFSPSELLNNPKVNSIAVFCVYHYIFSTKVLNFYDNSASRQFCSRRSSRHVVCIIQLHMLCRLLVLHAPLYTNIVDRKSRPFWGNLDKNAKNCLEQGALAIF